MFGVCNEDGLDALSWAALNGPKGESVLGVFRRDISPWEEGLDVILLVDILDVEDLRHRPNGRGNEYPFFHRHC